MRDENLTDLIGARIRQFRLEKEYSQEYMANRLGITQSGYSRSENNAGEMSVSKLNEIARILEIDLSDLITSNKNNYFQNNSLDNHSVGGNIIINHYPTEGLQKIEEMLIELVKNNKK